METPQLKIYQVSFEGRTSENPETILPHIEYVEAYTEEEAADRLYKGDTFSGRRYRGVIRLEVEEIKNQKKDLVIKYYKKDLQSE